MYKGFAGMYDALMTDAPYDIWAIYINGYLDELFNREKRVRREKKIVLDLACGTGNITLRLAEMGWDMIGVDASEDMLAEASRKACEQNVDILFLAQDMRELNLYGTVDAAVSVCDGMNYILDEDDLLHVFKNVRLFLNSGGVFIFDMNTEYKFITLLNNYSFEGFGEGGVAYDWENFYDPDTKINEYRMTFFSLDENGEKINPFTELHRQRAYTHESILRMLFEAGFASVAIRDGYSNEPIKPNSARVVFIAGM